MVVLEQKHAVASFDVDCQYTFTPECPGELPVPGGMDIVDELNLQAGKAAYRLGSKDAHHATAVWVADQQHPQFTPLQGDNVDQYWVPHAIIGTKGFESIAGLPVITEYDFFVWKGIELDMHPYGVCYHDLANRLSTGVIEFLRDKEVTTVIVGGLATDYCVKTTVLQLLAAGFQVIVNLGACRGIAKETIAIAQQEMELAGARFVESANDISVVS